jgi:twitching motility protein PilT
VIELETLLRAVMSRSPSDIHLRAGVPPILRISNKLVPFEQWPPLSVDDLADMARRLAPPERFARLAATGGVNLPLAYPELGRFRLTLLQARGHPCIAIRALAREVPTLETLNLPPVVGRLATERRGLVLVTGPAGSGKSTTLAAMVGLMNQERNDHVVTIEDPIEYVLENGSCYITQREIGVDVPSYDAALRLALRQDPNVVVVGEMRDAETFRAVLTLAQTGHLVLSTLHTGGAVDTVNRIITAFPHARETSIRAQLAHVLKGVIGQRLVQRADGAGLLPVTEILVMTGSIFRAIMEPHLTRTIPTIMSRSRDLFEMQTFDQCALDLFLRGLITEDTAIRTANSPMDFEVALRRSRQYARLEAPTSHEGGRAAGSRMEAIVVLEVVGMTDLLITHGDDTFRKFSDRVAAQLGRLAKEYRARAIEHHLDGFLLTFPNVDWAVLTLRSVFNRLSEFNELTEMEVAFRGALHYGSTWVDPHSNRVGAAVHKAFRVCAAIGTPDVWGPGRPRDKNVVVATEETREMLFPYNVSSRPLGSIPLKGFDGLHPIYELHLGPGT